MLWGLELLFLGRLADRGSSLVSPIINNQQYQCNNPYTCLTKESIHLYIHQQYIRIQHRQQKHEHLPTMPTTIPLNPNNPNPAHPQLNRPKLQNKKIIQRGSYICECLDGHFNAKDGIISGEVIVRDLESQRLVYQGEFFKSVKCGYGVQYGAKGEIEYEGDFANGKRNGWGRTKEYEGQFKDGDYDGWGRFFSPQVIYQGYFEQGRYHGLGFYMKAKTEFKKLQLLKDEQKLEQFITHQMSIHENRPFEQYNIEQIYIGHWQKGLKSGSGMIYNENGFWYRGQFAYNSIHGIGSRRVNGKVQRGSFQKGLFKG